MKLSEVGQVVALIADAVRQCGPVLTSGRRSAAAAGVNTRGAA